MRVLILIALLFTFTSGSFADTANASSVDHFCSHHKLDDKSHAINDAEKSDPCQSEHDKSQCDDCCCVHSHSIATLITFNKTPSKSKQQNITESPDEYFSVEISSLKHPPRL